MEKHDELIKGLMENYPEASSGNCLKCTNWDYGGVFYHFIDEETEKRHCVTLHGLRKGFKILINLALNGKYNNFASSALYDGGNWDAIDVDALVQCAIFGKVIYG